MWPIHIMDYYLIIKRNEILMLATMWMSLKNINRSERSQSHKKDILCDSIYMK